MNNNDDLAFAGVLIGSGAIALCIVSQDFKGLKNCLTLAELNR